MIKEVNTENTKLNLSLGKLRRIVKAHECSQEVPDWDKDPLKKGEPVFMSKHLDVTFGHMNICMYINGEGRDYLKSDRKILFGERRCVMQ